MLAWISMLTLLLSSCTTVLSTDLRGYLDEQDFPVHQGPVPEGSETIGLVAARDSGFYLFGFAPFWPMHIGDCVTAMVEETRSLGGDGVAEIRITYRPPTLLDVANGIFPGWFAHVELTGSAYRTSER